MLVYTQHPMIERMLRASINLSREEELIVVAQAQSDDEDVSRAALDKLVRANCRFVYKIVLKFATTDNFVDAFNIGCAGILKAAADYKIESGVRFMTYAVWWIRQHIITQGYRDNNIRAPNNFWSLRKKLEKKIADHEALDEDVPEKLRQRLDEIVQATATYNKVSLDSPIQSSFSSSGGTDVRTYADVVQDEDALASFDDIETALFMQRSYKQITAGIDPVDEFIVRAYHGLEGGEQYTYKEIADAIGVKFDRSISRERVRQRLAKALERMRFQAHQLGIR